MDRVSPYRAKATPLPETGGTWLELWPDPEAGGTGTPYNFTLPRTTARELRDQLCEIYGIPELKMGGLNKTAAQLHAEQVTRRR